ncbi:hypothetical protein OROHE_026674 [Orobanche hederae]
MGDRITALQQLVSPFGKTDTASVLSEAIAYIHFLHEQVSVLSNPYLKNEAPIQHHLQMHATSTHCNPTGQPAPEPGTAFRVGHRVHSIGQPRRFGTVKYVGPVEGFCGDWIGVDWDTDGEGKHEGSHNGVSYFTARGPNTASFVRPHNLSAGVSLLEALETRYRTASTKEEEDEMYVLSARNKRVSIELLGKHKIEDKLSRFEELTSVSLSYLGISFPGSLDSFSSTLPNIKELDLTGNLLANWEDIGFVCEGLPALTTLNLSNNYLSADISNVPQLSNVRILVLNQTGVIWKQVEILKDALPHVEELHLIGNKLSEITRTLPVMQPRTAFLNNNNIKHIWYPACGKLDEPCNGNEPHEKSSRPFSSLRDIFLGGNNIEDLESVDSLNSSKLLP